MAHEADETPEAPAAPQSIPSLISAVQAWLGVTQEEVNRELAYQAAALLMRAFGVTPVIDTDDHSRAAEIVRGLLVEHRTRTTTRSRRVL